MSNVMKLINRFDCVMHSDVMVLKFIYVVLKELTLSTKNDFGTVC